MDPNANQGERRQYRLPERSDIPAYRNPPARTTAPVASGVVGGMGWVAGICLVCLIFSKMGGLPQAPEASGNQADSSSASDGALLLETARQYDDDGYDWGGGHPPSEYDFGEGLDCSGLISVAVLEAFDIDDDRLAQDFRNSPHWEHIDIEDVREGDIVYLLMANHSERSSDHVAIVVSNGGRNDLTIFEAATSQGPHYNQIREDSGRSYGEWDGALRFHR
jgi:cell wall-associated NlpC family hydrolase